MSRFPHGAVGGGSDIERGWGVQVTADCLEDMNIAEVVTHYTGEVGAAMDKKALRSYKYSI